MKKYTGWINIYADQDLHYEGVTKGQIGNSGTGIYETEADASRQGKIYQDNGSRKYIGPIRISWMQSDAVPAIPARVESIK